MCLTPLAQLLPQAGSKDAQPQPLPLVLAARQALLRLGRHLAVVRPQLHLLRLQWAERMFDACSRSQKHGRLCCPWVATWLWCRLSNILHQAGAGTCSIELGVHAPDTAT